MMNISNYEVHVVDNPSRVVFSFSQYARNLIGDDKNIYSFLFSFSIQVLHWRQYHSSDTLLLLK